MFLLPTLTTAQSKPPADPAAVYREKAQAAMHEKRFDEAISLFEKADDAGDGNAMRFLGDTFYTGRFRNQDYQKARYWYEKAEVIGYLGASSMNRLGLIYLEGLGVKPDLQRAYGLFQKSAALDDVDGMYDLAKMYDQGIGVAQDYKQARQWYEKAAAKHHEAARKRLLELPK